MSEREDWFADAEGNLTPPEGDPPRPEPTPDTDEFGRDDPAAIERERRRREREARRKGGGGSKSARKRKAPKREGGEGGGLLGRRRRREPAASAPEQAPVEKQAPHAAGARAAASRGRDALRERLGRRGGGGAEPPAPSGRAGGFGRRRAIAIAVGVLGILLLWFLVALFQPFAGDGKGEGDVIVNIPKGADAGQVADILSEDDVISRGSLFEIRLRLAGKSDQILPGRYVMASGMSYGAAIDQLTGESSDGLITLTIPEGDSRQQTANLVAEVGITGDYMQASKNFKGFDPAKYGAPKNPPSLEGFLFPATYELEPGSTVEDLIGQQLTAFEQNITSVNMKNAKKKNLNVYDVVKIASMVDDEAQDPKERPLISAVIYNRLKIGEPLGIDATTRYEFNNYTEPITNEQLNSDSGYNTRDFAGLPPTPVTNPGLNAIEAAANPAKVNYLFFVVKPGTGCPVKHSFTDNLEEFNQLNAEYQEALQDQGGSPTGNC